MSDLAQFLFSASEAVGGATAASVRASARSPGADAGSGFGKVLSDHEPTTPRKSANAPVRDDRHDRDRYNRDRYDRQPPPEKDATNRPDRTARDAGPDRTQKHDRANKPDRDDPARTERIHTSDRTDSTAGAKRADHAGKTSENNAGIDEDVSAEAEGAAEAASGDVLANAPATADPALADGETAATGTGNKVTSVTEVRNEAAEFSAGTGVEAAAEGDAAAAVTTGDPLAEEADGAVDTQVISGAEAEGQDTADALATTAATQSTPEASARQAQAATESGAINAGNTGGRKGPGGPSEAGPQAASPAEPEIDGEGPDPAQPNKTRAAAVADIARAEKAAASAPRAQTPSFAAELGDRLGTQKPSADAQFGNLLPSSADASMPVFRASTPSTSGSIPSLPVRAIALHIANKAADGASAFQIRLDPPEMGRIDVRLEISRDGQATAHITADRPETLDALQRDQRGLERTLQNAGLDTKDGGLSFNLRQDGKAGGGDREDVAPRLGDAEADDESELPGEIMRPRRIGLSALDIRV